MSKLAVDFNLKSRDVTELKYSEIKPLREQILKKQKGVCPVCNQLVVSPVLDHEHKKKLKMSGQIRGVICLNCNVLLAKVENNAVRYKVSMKELPGVLRQMADYLDKRPYPFVHPTDKTKVKKLQKASYKMLVKKLKKIGFEKKIPEFPKSGTLTSPLEKLFKSVKLNPKFYK